MEKNKDMLYNLSDEIQVGILTVSQDMEQNNKMTAKPWDVQLEKDEQNATKYSQKTTITSCTDKLLTNSSIKLFSELS